jgi:hypothetical protein
MLDENTCYNSPGGVSMQWQQLPLGCHNPRLDLDIVQCDASLTNPSDTGCVPSTGQGCWCGPENINIDYPSLNQWYRIATHYYWNHGRTYDVHPEILVYCNGALSADLGPHSYYMPEAPVTFEPGDGESNIGQGNRFWVAADVVFTTDSCGIVSCTVQPVYSDAAQKTPFLTLDTAETTTFAPAYPPLPK